MLEMLFRTAHAPSGGRAHAPGRHLAHVRVLEDQREWWVCPTTPTSPRPAGARRGAGLIDAGVVAGLRWLARRRGLIRGREDVHAAAPGRASTCCGSSCERPGQLLLGIRTVDRRTGTRVALWRTLALAGASGGGRGAGSPAGTVRGPGAPASPRRTSPPRVTRSSKATPRPRRSGTPLCESCPRVTHIASSRRTRSASSSRPCSSVSSAPACAGASRRRSRCSPAGAEITGRRSGR